MIQKTLVLVKPDGVSRGLIGEITKRFETAGLKIIAMKMKWIDEKFSKQHYEAHVEKPFYPSTEEYITSGPVVAMVIEGVESIEAVRKIVGGTEPKTATPGTIRGDFAHVSYAYADDKKISVKNLVHASGSVEDAKKEVSLWFNEDEIHTYKTAYEAHTQ